MRFSTGLMMTAGALIALTTGLCSLAATVMIVSLAFSNLGGNAPGASMGLLVFLIIPAICFLITALGVWLFRRGRAKARAEAGLD